MINIIIIAISILFFELAPAADYTLEIIQPISGLNTSSRFYKAYPNLEYNIKVAVIGGKYPYQYALTTAPSGMTIDAATGIISWDNPTATGSPHNVTAIVTDSEASQQSVSWTVTVTTSGFYFVDAVNGSNNSARGGTGTGTIANPWKDMQDFYGGPTNISSQPSAKNDSTYNGGFVYFRSGTYASGDMPLEDGWRIPFIGNNKPQVWIAYPGETPVINLAGGVIELYSGGENFYVDGIHFRINGNSNARGVRLPGNTNNVTFIRNTFDGDGMVGWEGGNNGMLMSTGGPDTGINNMWVIAHNSFIDTTTSGMGFEGYSTNKLLLENNTASGINGHVFYPKMGTTDWHIRGNKITNCTVTGINVGNYVPSGDINIFHNYIQMNSGYAIHLNEQWITTSTGPFRVYRNTLSGGVAVNQVSSTNGPFYITDNVIVNGTSGDKLTKNSIDYPSNLIVSGTLGATSGLFDENGLLLSAYDENLGVTGWQFDDGSTPFDGTYDPPTPTNGECNTTTEGQSYAGSCPSSNLCTAGTASSVTSDSDSCDWTCVGIDGGTTDTCMVAFTPDAPAIGGMLISAGTMAIIAGAMAITVQ